MVAALPRYKRIFMPTSTAQKLQLHCLVTCVLYFHFITNLGNFNKSNLYSNHGSRYAFCHVCCMFCKGLRINNELGIIPVQQLWNINIRYVNFMFGELYCEFSMQNMYIITILYYNRNILVYT